jgi:predicted nucleotidyltransferase component of viral defense system
MNIFEKHEIFEIETLEKLKNARVLDVLVFGGGTMLRLCHELKRYSADLDFWRIKDMDEKTLFDKIQDVLQKDYDITDAQIKHFTILIEIRSKGFQKRLKIEIRKEIQDWDVQEKIAFSRFSNKQVALKAHTLEQTMINKIAALLERAEVRDGFDIEFLLRQGILMPDIPETDKAKLISRLDSFKPNDFKVKLGSVLESDIRTYYIENQFKYLRRKLTSVSLGRQESI